MVKAWKGGLHMLCMIWHDARSCVRYVETYHNLIAAELFKGPLGRNFTCTEVLKFCASPFQRDPLQDFIANKTAKYKLNTTVNDDYLDNLYASRIKYK